MYRDICHLNRRAQLFGPLCLALGLEAAIVAGIGPPPAHADAGAESDSSRPAERSASPSAKGTSSSLGGPSRISSSRNHPTAHNAAAIADRESSPGPSLSRVLFPDAPSKPPSALLALPGSPRHDGPPDPAASASVIPPAFAARLHVPEVLAKPASFTPAIAPAEAVAAPDQAIIATAISPTPPLEASSAVAIASPPAASASLGAAISGLLSALSIALSGGQPRAPADTSVALLGAAGRSVRTSRSQTSAATENAVSTAPAASTDSTPTSTVEAEHMTSSGGVRIVFDREASSSYALALSGSGTASTTVALAESTALTIRVKSSEGAPDMTLSIDGETVTTLLVESRSYADYMFAGKIAEGSHVITISSSTATSQNTLYVDNLVTSTGPILDEFLGEAGTAPDGRFWTVRSGTGFDSGEQKYVARKAVLDGRGHLVLKANRTRNGTYKSGWVWTKNHISFGYGTITARIKMPGGQGLWPAFWMMGADSDTVGWPQSGEIDIAELPSTNTTIYSTLHGPIAGDNGTQQDQIISNLPDVSTGFHNYWVRHLEDEITFGFDDLTLGTFTPDSLQPGETWVYNRPMYVILNLGVGGPWAGAPDSSTHFPAKMRVDYLRWDSA